MVFCYINHLSSVCWRYQKLEYIEQHTKQSRNLNLGIKTAVASKNNFTMQYSFQFITRPLFTFNIKLPKTPTAVLHHVPWVPKYVVLFLSQSFGSLYPSIYLLSTSLLMQDSSINPILYIWRDPRLRATLKSIVNTWKHLQANSNKQSSRNHLWNCTH